MRQWNVAICDDEKAALSILSGAVLNAFQAHDVQASVVLFANPKLLLKDMRQRHFDLLFLDIDMPGMTGIQLAQQLRSAGDTVDIIYISNREDMVFEALRTGPKGFIRKSRFIQDITGVVDAYFTNWNDAEAGRSLCVQDAGGVLNIPLEKLMYIEGNGKQQLAYLAGEKEPVALHRRMQELEEELEKDGFLRIHKGYLVNFRFIRHIGSGDVTLTTGNSIPISRRKEQEVRDAYLRLMQGDGSLVL